MRPLTPAFVTFMRRARPVICVFGGGGGGSTGPSVATSTAQLQNGSGAPLNIGQVVYLKGDGTIALASTVPLAPADLVRSSAVGIVQDATIAAGAFGTVVLYGLVTGLVGGVVGQKGYLSQTPGLIDSVQDATPGHCASVLGVWLDATHFRFQPTSPYLL